MNRYQITLNKQSFLTFFGTKEGCGVTYLPLESGVFSNEVEEDIVVTQIFIGDDDVTVQFLTDYSTWISTQG